MGSHLRARPTRVHLRFGAPVEEMTGSGVTSASYLKRSPAVPWTKDDTEKFYDALSK